MQGAAAALIIPQTIGLIKAMFSGEETSKALGSIGPVMGLAAVCVPVVGGVLTHADLFGSSWRSAFLVNAPVAAVVVYLINGPWPVPFVVLAVIEVAAVTVLGVEIVRYADLAADVPAPPA